MTLVWANRLCNLTHCVLFHPLCNFTQCVIWLTIQHTSHNFHTTHGFEFSDGSLCCSVARQLLLQIYALSSVKFPHLKLQFCKKNDKYEVLSQSPGSPSSGGCPGTSCLLTLRIRDGRCILCQMKLAQEGKFWKAQNLQSFLHSKISRSKSKQSNLCSNSRAKLHCYPHFPSFTPIKPRSGYCHHLTPNLDWPWNWLAVGNGLPCNDFDWPIIFEPLLFIVTFSIE